MSIYHLSNQSVYSIGQLDFKKKLKAGQIIQGKILELFPNQKARIQLGNKQLIAQIEAPLVSGETYYLKVENMEELLHLKVIGMAENKQGKEGLTKLLHRLKLPITQELLQITQLLLSEKISFHPQDLKTAYSLIHKTENKELGKQIIKNMLLMEYPIKSSVFKALMAKEVINFPTISSAVLKQIQSQEKRSLLQEKLIMQLRTLIEKIPSGKEMLLREIFSDIRDNNSRMFHLLKIAGNIDLNTNYAVWKSKWEQLFGKVKQDSNILDVTKWNHTNLPFPLKEKTFFTVVEQMVHSKKKIQYIVNEILQNKPKLTRENQVHIQQMIEKMPPLFQKQLRTMIQMLNNHDELFRTLETFQREETYHYLINLTNLYKKNRHFLSLPMKDQFLLHAKDSIDLIGLNHEQLVTKMEANKDSVKAIILKLMNEHQGIDKQTHQQLVHVINGLQLHSIQESQQMLQVYLQMPGKKLGLTKPIDITFAGKKGKNGALDGDYCRIIFYLNLAYLNKTVIDMHVQKRTVTLTVYNDLAPLLKEKTGPLELMLKKGLKDIDYQLITITYRTLANKQNQNIVSKIDNKTYSYEGIDFRI